MLIDPNEWVNFIKIVIKDHPWKGHDLETPNSEDDSDMRIVWNISGWGNGLF